MLQIELTSNDNRRINGTFIVSEEKYDSFLNLQYEGGFKRFEIDIVDECPDMVLTGENELDLFLCTLMGLS